jgi:hypothetical protein
MWVRGCVRSLRSLSYPLTFLIGATLTLLWQTVTRITLTLAFSQEKKSPTPPHELPYPYRKPEPLYGPVIPHAGGGAPGGVHLPVPVPACLPAPACLPLPGQGHRHAVPVPVCPTLCPCRGTLPDAGRCCPTLPRCPCPVPRCPVPGAPTLCPVCPCPGVLSCAVPLPLLCRWCGARCAPAVPRSAPARCAGDAPKPAPTCTNSSVTQTTQPICT